MARKTVGRAGTKRALAQAGTPIFDSVVADLHFDPLATWVEPSGKHAAATPKTVAKRVRRKQPVTA